ncbi:hypothetical protein [Aurantiacibacter gilvus]|uniref:Uncharacterized protein n=1 Tax=Aurantiacibacter gilvus TaxID=3139141 RepID=A0ABU9IAT3_9SPHN
MRRLGAVCAGLLALVATPAAAQETGLRGVWQGTVGNLPVHACFNGEDGDGVYYYDRHKLLIGLLNEEGVFAERIGYDDPGEANWRMTAIEGGSASGTWQEGARALPITLQRLEWEQGRELASPCESMAFMGPRLSGGRIESAPGEIAGQAYTVLRYVPPAHFDEEDVAISTFALVSSVRSDVLVNQQLAFDLPRGDVSDDYAQCFGMHAAFRGLDGYFYKEVRPEVLTERWVGAIEHNSLYCGGAHPSHWSLRRVYDRYYGTQVQAQQWLNDRALDREIISEGFVFATVSKAFMPVLLGNWYDLPEGSPEGDVAHRTECIEIAGRTPNWDVGLAEDGSGLAFIPGVPHAATPCAETVVVPWDDLSPFLTIEGQAVASTFVSP